MKLFALASLFLLLCAPAALAQAGGSFRISSVFPYDRVVPGQIIELRVENMGEQLLGPPPGDALRIVLTQDGATKTVSARTANPGMVRETAPGSNTPGELKPMHAVSFVVPKGLHVGEAEVVVSFRGRKSAPFKLNVVERPQRPLVALTSIVSIAPAAVTPQSPQRMTPRFERGAKGVEIRVMPLADPEDAEAGVVIRFKQGGTFYDAASRVVHHAGGSRSLPGGRGFSNMAARDELEVDVPELLAPGEAEMEVSLRAGGLTGEAALVPVTITDAERAFESPKAAAPRLLSVTPRRVGAGQALNISVDRRRALDPDPSKVTVVFETPDGTSSQSVAPELNSAVMMPSMPTDVPVFLIVRAPKQLTGTVNVRLVNPARADYEGASSEPAQIEVTAEALAPEVRGAAEASADEYLHLRQLGAAQPADSRMAPVYDSSARYVSIRVRGLDPNPNFVRVRFAQEGRATATLGKEDLALYTGDSIVVRLPKGFGAGVVRVSVENLGASGYSEPAQATFQLSPRR
ncbi:MAG TPA: hypothetical protein VF297_06440 [Pyrinomonadaceae bacterium]